jgi:hypothetical protein
MYKFKHPGGQAAPQDHILFLAHLETSTERSFALARSRF